MQNRLFLLTDGVEKGPFTPAEIVEMVGKGELTPYDFLRREGDARWVRAGDLKPLADLFGDFSPTHQRIEALSEVIEGEAPGVTSPRCRAAASALFL
jgi:hypothetical protein